jgi:hypothetical protein
MRRWKPTTTCRRSSTPFAGVSAAHYGGLPPLRTLGRTARPRRLRARATSPHTLVLAGIYDVNKEPVLKMKSGETVMIEVASHHGGQDYAKMIKGDPALEAIYDWKKGQSLLQKAVPKTPRSGVHIVTGPVEVEGAEVGDILQVACLALPLPLPSPAPL